MKIDDADVQNHAIAPKLQAAGHPISAGVAHDRRAWVFAAALSTIFMAAIEGTIVATAMPTIVGDLGGFELFSWVFSAYLLTQAIMIPIYGRLADVYGRKPILLFGIGVFLIGSVLCGLAWNMTSLIAFRVVQGIGAGSLVPVAQTVVGDIYSGEQRARMQGYISSTFGSAAVLGPMIGSFLANNLNWQMVFWVNIPLGIIAAFMLMIALKEKVQKRQHRIDFVGAALMASATGILMLALVHADRIDRVAAVGVIVTCGSLFAALVVYERRTPEPLLPFRLFRNRIVAGGNTVAFANGAMMMSIVGFLPAYMQGVMGASTFIAGAALGGMSVAWSCGGFAGSRLMLWTSYRIAAMIGGGFLVAGSLMMIALHIGTGAVQPITGALLMGLGMGVTNICFVVAIQANVDWSQRAAATSSIAFSRIVGQSFGSAVFGGILNVGLSSYASGGGDTIAGLMRSGRLRGPNGADIQPVIEALTRSLHNIYLLSGLISLAVLATILSLPYGLKLIDRR